MVILVNNIGWRLKNKILNITLNPKQLKIVEIPFSIVGEVAGIIQYGTYRAVMNNLQFKIHKDIKK
jgi:hypothetical protein